MHLWRRSFVAVFLAASSIAGFVPTSAHAEDAVAADEVRSIAQEAASYGLRAEPMVLCVPEIEKDRYYSALKGTWKPPAVTAVQ